MKFALHDLPDILRARSTYSTWYAS